MQHRDSQKKQKLADLLRETSAAPPAAPTPPAAPWVQGNHTFVINGGSVAIHMAPNACPIQKEGCDE